MSRGIACTGRIEKGGPGGRPSHRRLRGGISHTETSSYLRNLAVPRDFCATFICDGGAAAWPLAARAQQSKVPVIGYLGLGSAAASAQTLAVFRQSLAEAGYVEGRNVAIEYRFAEGQYDRLPAMAAELVRREVAVIVASGGTGPALAAKAATATIPMVFGVTNDPVALGLVVSFARPGGNATGINFPLAEVPVKELGLLHEVVPAARRIGLLVNPNNSPSAAVTKDVTAAASALGIEIGVVRFHPKTRR